MRVCVVEGGYAPKQPASGDVGYDCYAREGAMVHPRGTALIPLGFSAVPAAGCYLKLEERSGLARNGINVGGGIVDPGYRGELQVIVRNVGTQSRQVKAGDRICQIVQSPFVVTPIELVDSLDETERGANGFGSSGR